MPLPAEPPPPCAPAPALPPFEAPPLEAPPLEAPAAPVDCAPAEPAEAPRRSGEQPITRRTRRPAEAGKVLESALVIPRWYRETGPLAGRFGTVAPHTHAQAPPSSRPRRCPAVSRLLRRSPARRLPLAREDRRARRVGRPRAC